MEALAELEDIATAGGLYEDVGLVYREVVENLPEEAGEQRFVVGAGANALPYRRTLL